MNILSIQDWYDKSEIELPYKHIHCSGPYRPKILLDCLVTKGNITLDFDKAFDALAVKLCIHPWKIMFNNCLLQRDINQFCDGFMCRILLDLCAGFSQLSIAMLGCVASKTVAKCLKYNDMSVGILYCDLGIQQ